MNQDVYSAMQTGEPIKRYIKGIVGQVHVTVLNPFSGQPEGVILKGNPKNPTSECFVEIWDDKSLVFFTRLNAKHLQAGRIVEYTKNVVETPSPNQITDEEIDRVLNDPFLTLDNKLKSFTSDAPIMRILERARELEKSERILKRIQEALAEVQLT